MTPGPSTQPALDGFQTLLADWAEWSATMRLVNGEVADAIDTCIAELEALL